jgi:hypothetical protein
MMGEAVTAPVILPIGRYRLLFRPQQDLRFTGHAGSAWRGAFTAWDWAATC